MTRDRVLAARVLLQLPLCPEDISTLALNSEIERLEDPVNRVNDYPMTRVDAKWILCHIHCFFCKLLAIIIFGVRCLLPDCYPRYREIFAAFRRLPDFLQVLIFFELLRLCRRRCRRRRAGVAAAAAAPAPVAEPEEPVSDNLQALIDQLKAE